jgi:hypothetical protein
MSPRQPPSKETNVSDDARNGTWELANIMPGDLIVRESGVDEEAQYHTVCAFSLV